MDTPTISSRLLEATNAHDVDGIVACFHPDYTNETPCHPARGFRGREQVRKNWTAILAAVPDLEAQIVAAAIKPGVEWTEWEMSGTRRDGAHHLMRGVMVFTVDDGLATGCRFFLEPVDGGSDGVDQAVATLVEGGPGR
jgi:ketosteroid isomerase-like protein